MNESTRKPLRRIDREFKLAALELWRTSGLLTLRSEIGSTRVLDMLSGEQLPRIC